MDDRDTFTCACALASEHGKTAIEVASRRIEAALTKGDGQEAGVWRSVRETLIQVDGIACCFAANDIIDVAMIANHEDLSGALARSSISSRS